MTLVRYHGNFVECKQQIKNAGQRIATARQGMQDRIRQGPYSDYVTKGCWYPEGTTRISKENYWCLGKFAPTTHYPQETLVANANGEYLSLTDEIKLGGKPASQLIREIAEQDAELPDYQRRVLIPENQGTFSVDLDCLGEVDIARFLARSPELAEQYGKFLKQKCGFSQVTFCQMGGVFGDIATGFWI